MILLTFLVSSPIVRRLVAANVSTNIQSSSSPSSSWSTIKSEKFPQIKVALCIQRYAYLSPEMNQLEKDYTNLITQLEIENSHLSDHELRHKTEV